jgi:cytochrome c553
VVAQLFLFREGRRDNPVMIAAAKGLTNSDLTAFAERVTKLPPPPPPDDSTDPVRFAARPDAHPSPPVRRLPQSGFLRARADAASRPSARGLSAQVHARVSERARLGYGGAMAQELAGLTDQDLIDLAHYLSHLGAKAN